MPRHFRAHFAQTTQAGIFFDNASMGPVAPEVTAAMRLHGAAPSNAHEILPLCRHSSPPVRKKLSRLIGRDPDELVFMQKCCLRHQLCRPRASAEPGDNVILCDREFSLNAHLAVPEMGPGEAASFPPRWSDCLVAIRTRTRAVTVSSVEFSARLCTDLDAIGHRAATTGPHRGLRPVAWVHRP